MGYAIRSFQLSGSIAHIAFDQVAFDQGNNPVNIRKKKGMSNLEL